MCEKYKLIKETIINFFKIILNKNKLVRFLLKY